MTAQLLRWESQRSNALNLVSYACLALSVVQLGIALFFMISGRVTLPSHDVWWFLKNMVELGGVLPAAWIQYENHRLLLVSLLTYADMSLFGGHYWLGFVLVMASFGGFFAYLIIIVPRHLGRDAVAWRLAYALALTLVFALTNSEGFVLPYRAWVPLNLLLATITMFIFAQHETEAEPTRRRRLLILVIVLAITGTFTGGPGLLIWPALLVTALLVRTAPGPLAAILSSAAVTLTLYFYGTSGFFQQGRGGLGNILDPLHFLISLAAVTGAPIASSLFLAPLSQASLPFAFIIGGAALIAAALIGISALRRPPRRQVEIALLGAMVFAFGWVVTSVIKHQPPPPAPWAPLAKSSDYMATMTFWAVLSARLILYAASRPTPWPIGGCAAAALGVTLLLLPLQIQSGLRLLTFKHEVRLSNWAFLAGTREAERSAQELDYDPSPAIRELIRAMALPPLSIGAARAVGAPLAVPTGALRDCAGSLSGSASVEGGVRLWGFWADLIDHVDRVILVGSPAGTVSGIGDVFPRLYLPPRVNLDGLPERGGWVAYGGRITAGQAALYGATRDGTLLCRFTAAS